MKRLSNFLERLKPKPGEVGGNTNKLPGSGENKETQKEETSSFNEPASEVNLVGNKAIKSAEEAAERFKENIRKAFGGK